MIFLDMQFAWCIVVCSACPRSHTQGLVREWHHLHHVDSVLRSIGFLCVVGVVVVAVVGVVFVDVFVVAGDAVGVAAVVDFVDVGC